MSTATVGNRDRTALLTGSASAANGISSGTPTLNNYVVYAPRRGSEFDSAPVEAACAFCGSFDWLPKGNHNCEDQRKAKRDGGLGAHDFGAGEHLWCSWCGQQWQS